jgi:hypothetical protein
MIKPDSQARDFLSGLGVGWRNNCFIATDDNEVLAENSRFRNGNLLFGHSLIYIRFFYRFSYCIT